MSEPSARKAPEQKPFWRNALVLGLVAALLVALAAAPMVSRASPARETVAAEDTSGKKPRKDAPPKTAREKKKKRKKPPPEYVRLPAAGDYPAPRLLRLAGKLAGAPVHVAEKRINKRSVTVTRQAAHERVDLAELRLLLAAHSLYVHAWNHPEEGELLVASSSSTWKPPAPEYSRVFKIRPGHFEETWRVVREEIDLINARRPKNAPKIVAVSAPRTAKILVWAPTRVLLDNVRKLIDKLHHEQPEQPRLFSYSALFVPAGELRQKALLRLTAGEKKRVRMVVAGVGNQLLYRADAELAARVRSILKELDAH